MDGPESYSRELIAVQPGLKLVGVNPFGSENAERKGIADPDIQIALELSDYSGGRIIDCGLGIWNVGRRKDPW